MLFLAGFTDLTGFPVVFRSMMSVYFTLCASCHGHDVTCDINCLQTSETTPNIVAPTMLGVVACVLAVVCKRMQHVTSNDFGSCCQQCCVRLHGALKSLNDNVIMKVLFSDNFFVHCRQRIFLVLDH